MLEPDLAKQRAVVAAFLAAARGADFDALLRLLDPDVVLRADSGPGRPLAPPLLVGAQAVCRQIARQGPRFIPHCQPALVNGAAGLVARLPAGRGGAVIGITVASGRITEIDLILDPDKRSCSA